MQFTELAAKKKTTTKQRPSLVWASRVFQTNTKAIHSLSRTTQGAELLLEVLLDEKGSLGGAQRHFRKWSKCCSSKGYLPRAKLWNAENDKREGRKWKRIKKRSDFLKRRRKGERDYFNQICIARSKENSFGLMDSELQNSELSCQHVCFAVVVSISKYISGNLIFLS